MNIEEHKRRVKEAEKKNIGCINCTFAHAFQVRENDIGVRCIRRNPNERYLRKCSMFIHKDSIKNKLRLFMKNHWDWALTFLVSLMTLILTILK